MGFSSHFFLQVLLQEGVSASTAARAVSAACGLPKNHVKRLVASLKSGWEHIVMSPQSCRHRSVFKPHMSSRQRMLQKKKVQKKRASVYTPSHFRPECVFLPLNWAHAHDRYQHHTLDRFYHNLISSLVLKIYLWNNSIICTTTLGVLSQWRYRLVRTVVSF